MLGERSGGEHRVTTNGRHPPIAAVVTTTGQAFINYAIYEDMTKPISAKDTYYQMKLHQRHLTLYQRVHCLL